MGNDFAKIWKRQQKQLQRANKKLIAAFDGMLTAAEIARDEVARADGIDDALKKEIVDALDEVADSAFEGLEGAKSAAEGLKGAVF